jgi:hypothetical protein
MPREHRITEKARLFQRLSVLEQLRKRMPTVSQRPEDLPLGARETIRSPRKFLEVPSQGRIEKRQRCASHLLELLRARRAESRPRVLRLAQMAACHRAAQAEQLGRPRGLHRSEVFGFTDDRDRRAAQRGERIEHLDELQLIVQIVLEPEHDLVVLARELQSRVARSELLERFAERHIERTSDERRALGRKLRERKARPDRSFMQCIAPRQENAARDLLENRDGAIAVRNMNQNPTVMPRLSTG